MSSGESCYQCAGTGTIYAYDKWAKDPATGAFVETQCPWCVKSVKSVKSVKTDVKQAAVALKRAIAALEKTMEKYHENI